MNMTLMEFEDAEEEFLRIYESETGRKAENLGVWELAASVRPMIDPVERKVDRPRAAYLSQVHCGCKEKGIELFGFL